MIFQRQLSDQLHVKRRLSNHLSPRKVYEVPTEYRPVLMPPSSFILPAHSRETLRKSSFPDEAVVRASYSTHPASTLHTSPDSRNQLEFSLSSEASSSSRGLEEDEGREDNSSAKYCKEE